MIRGLKGQSRIMGVDDGPYVRGSKVTPIVMTIWRLSGYIEGFLTAMVRTDGDDSSEVIADRLMASRFSDQVRCIISDGGCLAGFNVLDLDDLHRRTGIPIITCSDEAPDQSSFERAIRKATPDWEGRLSTISRHKPVPIDLDDGTIYVRTCGLDIDSATDILRRATVHGRVPEPVRISHMVARELITGRCPPT